MKEVRSAFAGRFIFVLYEIKCKKISKSDRLWRKLDKIRNIWYILEKISIHLKQETTFLEEKSSYY